MILGFVIGSVVGGILLGLFVSWRIKAEQCEVRK